MNNLNSVLIEGNLTKDPELACTPKGTPVCRFSIATNRFYKQEEEYQKEVSYFDVTVWAKQAEICSEYLKKGRGVRVVGRLKQDRWQNQEGDNRSKVLIIAEHVEFRPKREPVEEAKENQDAAGALPDEVDTEQSLEPDKEKEEQLTL